MPRSRRGLRLPFPVVSSPAFRLDPQVQHAAARGARATLHGILASAVLATIKVLTGIVGNSYALVADGVESLLDIFSGVVVLGSLRVSAVPPNERFPFGYGRAEPLAALVVAGALVVTALGLAIQSVREVITPHHAPEPYTLVVLLVVIAAKEIMFRRLVRTGRTIGSQAIENDAWQHRSDAVTSIAAFAGITAALVLGPGYEAADDWAALFACGVIAWNGVRLFRGALAEVLDAAVPPDVVNRIRQIGLAVPGVHDLEKIRVRKSGLSYFAEIHIEVDGAISVREGHHIAHLVDEALQRSAIPLVGVALHVEPAPPASHART
jgi:cation diffusion facilitator family transporter